MVPCIEDSMINIFKYVDYPLNLALTCQNWSVIAKDPYVKTEWLIVHYGLFHAVILDHTYSDIPVCQNLIAIKVILLRYLIQRLLMYFGKYDQKLIELKIEHNVGQLADDRICALLKIKSWASNLPIFGFTYLLNEVYKQLAGTNENFPPKSNDIELFLFFSAGTQLINYALKKHLNDIRFTPFPHRLRVLKSFGFLQQECFLSKNNRQQGSSPNRSLTVLSLFTNDVGIFGARPSRIVSQRRRQRKNQLNINRIYRRPQLNALINNEDTLNRLANLSQQVTNDPLINQFFNGSSFI